MFFISAVTLSQLRYDSQDPRSEEREDPEGVPRSLQLRELCDLHTGWSPGPQVRPGHTVQGRADSSDNNIFVSAPPVTAQ